MNVATVLSLYHDPDVHQQFQLKYPIALPGTSYSKQNILFSSSRVPAPRQLRSLAPTI